MTERFFIIWALYVAKDEAATGVQAVSANTYGLGNTEDWILGVVHPRQEITQWAMGSTWNAYSKT